MAVFNVSFLNPNIRASTAGSNMSVLMDQLAIKQNQLEVDGNLSSADYDLLIKDTQKILTMPGLTPQDRAQVQVKLSQYSSDKSKKTLTKQNDIQRMNRDLEDNTRKATMAVANSPKDFLDLKAAALEDKISQLSFAIDNLDSSGQDASNHRNEFNSTLNEYQDIIQAIEDTKNYQPGSGKSGSNFVAYVTTNSKGEIQDVQVGRVGAKSGYSETNGLYGGLPIYGKINKKEANGKNVFILGNTRFSGSDLIIQDPNVPGSFRNAPLLDESTIGGKNIGIAVQSYKDMTPADLRAQNSIGDGEWVQGSSGAFYNKLPGGGYKKYINTDASKLNNPDGRMFKVPAAFEASINDSVQDVVDGSIQQSAPPQNIATQPESQPIQTTQPQQTSGLVPAGGSSKTPSPVTRAPQNSQSIAQRALSSAGNFLSRVFNR